MIETHIHVLPKIDDGPQNFPECLGIVKSLKDLGYTKIISTSHYWQNYWEPDKIEINTKITTLNQAIKDLNWEIEIYPGCELRITETLFDQKEPSFFQSINNTKYMLVDFYPDIEEKTFNQLKILINKGFTPIIAHPERYPSCTEAETITKLKTLGVLFQLTVQSLLINNRNMRSLAIDFIKKDLYHLIGSDSHDSFKHFYPVTKLPTEIRTLIGEGKLQLLTEINCVKILQGENI